jgi:hypothetical protein
MPVLSDLILFFARSGSNLRQKIGSYPELETYGTPYLENSSKNNCNDKVSLKFIIVKTLNNKMICTFSVRFQASFVGSDPVKISDTNPQHCCILTVIKQFAFVTKLRVIPRGF